MKTKVQAPPTPAARLSSAIKSSRDIMRITEIMAGIQKALAEKP
ncbi:MAG: hypothetical protein ABSA12_15140 [Verrucomicrobiia bacterium]